MGTSHTITFIKGDGIGPEVTQATQRIINATDVKINWEECLAGAEIFRKGQATGVPQETIDSLLRNRVALKGPLETPVGFGEKSANVTLRKLFETYANIRPVREFPNVPTPYQGRKIDFVIVRENVEDLYSGDEYMQTAGAALTLKLITRMGCEKICRMAFEFARSEGRKKVHCATKANIMKFSEGMLKRTFEEISTEYPDIEASHIIVDNCAHQLVRFPEKFDVIVTTNMNGDILSDLGSGLIGGLGFAPGANLGNNMAIFEAVHGSAPKYAGKDEINPTAVLLSGVMMLRYLKEFEAALAIEQAVAVTLEQGYFTRDVKGPENAVTTTEFTNKIIDNLGKSSNFWPKRTHQTLMIPTIPKKVDFHQKDIKLLGFDLFIQSDLNANEIGKDLENLSQELPVQLTVISNRGVKVYPSPGTTPDVVDLWRCRFMAKNKEEILSDHQILQSIEKISNKYCWMHVEKLNVFGDKLGYSKSQGEE
ncbi:MAG: NADP-dependent isocitrate dehydrogenase [Janthinobacterium lividum]